MKQRMVALMCALLLLLLCACQNKNEELLEPVSFYYCNDTVSFDTADGVIRSELREGKHFSSDAENMLREYLLGPKSEDLVSPIPAGTKLVSYMQSEEVAKITLSKEFDTSGIKLSLASGCIAKTLAEYVPITEVEFYVEDGLIDNKEFLAITVADIVLADMVEQKG